jgi:shikimate kinase
MDNYENQLDEIRIKLFEETIGMEKGKIIELVNSHAQKIAHEFGINITKETKIESRLPSVSGAS